MSSSEKHTLLRSAWQQLAAYHTLQCAQHHETVVQISPAADSRRSDHPDWQIRLKGLCDIKLRNSTLGCSHNNVLTRYNKLIGTLVNEELIDEKNIPLEEINDIVLRIYFMDHEKGTLEKAHAVWKQDLSRNREAGEEAARKLQILREEHARLVNRLDLLHQNVLQELSRIMEAEQQTGE
jgi:galactokinase